MSRLTIGMPAGSLADPTRGGSLVSLLAQAGFETSGYEKGGPSTFKTVNFLYGWEQGNRSVICHISLIVFLM